jgi:hypothetical protein
MIEGFKGKRKATRYDRLPIHHTKISEYMKSKNIRHRPDIRWTSELNASYYRAVARGTIGKLVSSDNDDTAISEYFRKLVNSDVLWDEVVNITEKPTEVVYDFEVPTTHNFIGNAFILHNSGRRIISVLRHPSYAGELIWESDFIMTPRLGANEAKRLVGYTPKVDIDFDVQDLKINFRDASQWLLMRKGDPDSPSFFPLPPPVDSGVKLG